MEAGLCSVLIVCRYPSYIDALRDLDDCLCLVFLFATLPQHKNTKMEAVQKCRRLSGKVFKIFADADKFIAIVDHMNIFNRCILKIMVMSLFKFRHI